MRLQTLLILALAWVAAALLPSPIAAAKAPLRVVATMTILADVTRAVGGDRVEVTSLIEPGADPHGFEPSPQQVALIDGADVVIANGLGLEPWLDRLLGATGKVPHLVIASSSVAPLIGMTGTPDPHAWQDVTNARHYARTIASAFAEVDPDGRSVYGVNLARYDADLQALDGRIREAINALPPERHKIVTTHDAFAYFGRAYGLELIAPLGRAADAEPSAKDVATIIRQIRADHIPALFLETALDPRLMNRIAAESGAKIGGTLYADALSAEKGPAGTYIAMMETNIRELTQALAP